VSQFARLNKVLQWIGSAVYVPREPIDFPSDALDASDLSRQIACSISRDLPQQIV
jgi:hypothetical protein